MIQSQTQSIHIDY